METKGVVLCSVVALLGVVSAATGFAAEAKRIKPSDVNFVTLTQCSYPRSAAFGLGFTAAAALLMAQVIINFATGCCFCCKRTRPSGNSNWTKAVFYNVTSWITFVIAFFLLLAASALNDQHDLETTYNGNYYCYVVKPGVFAGGAFLAALTVILGIFYYVTLNTGKSTSGPCGNAALPPNPSQGGIAIPTALNLSSHPTALNLLLLCMKILITDGSSLDQFRRCIVGSGDPLHRKGARIQIKASFN